MAELLINSWEKGIGESALDQNGFFDVHGVDIYSEPGFLKSGFIGSNIDTAGTIGSAVLWLRNQDASNTDWFALGDNGMLYRYTGGALARIPGNSQTTGKGLAVWKNNVFAVGNQGIDVYSLGSSAWVEAGSSGWISSTFLESTSFSAGHFMLVGQDDILYIANERYVASIQENSGSTFNPKASGTYTANAQALDLPAGYRIRCMEELGEKLMLGTWQGSNIYDKKIADIYPWNRTSSSFEIPIRLRENGIQQMIEVNNLLYIVAGTKHNLYVTNGATVRKIGKVPNHIWNHDGGVFASAFPDAIEQYDNRILTGSSKGTADATKTPMGIWSIDQSEKLVFEHEMSSGSSGLIEIGSILGTGVDSYYASWSLGGTNVGIDIFRANGRQTAAAKSYVRSPLYAVGTKKKPATFSEIEIQLGNDLATGQSVIVNYRTNLTDGFTNLVTFSFATYGAVDSFSGDIGLIDIEKIQIEVQIVSNSTSTASPKVSYIKLF